MKFATIFFLVCNTLFVSACATSPEDQARWAAYEHDLNTKVVDPRPIIYELGL
jgi:outer membrane lipoprotein-sorting protein